MKQVIVPTSETDLECLLDTLITYFPLPPILDFPNSGQAPLAVLV